MERELLASLLLVISASAEAQKVVLEARSRRRPLRAELERVRSFSSDVHETTAEYEYPETMDYVVDVAVNTSFGMKTYGAILDTGSTNLALALSWCDCGGGKSDLDIAIDEDRCIKVVYGSGSWSGFETVATQVGFVMEPPLLVTTTFSGIAEENWFFNGGGFQGILGLGYPSLASPYLDCSASSAMPSEPTAAPPLLDSLRDAELINAKVVSITFCSLTADVLIGDVPQQDMISYVPTQKTLGQFYGYYLVYLETIFIHGSPLRFLGGGEKDSIDEATLNYIGGVLIDTGTTLMYFPRNVVAAMEMEVLPYLGLDVETYRGAEFAAAFFHMQWCLSEVAVLRLPNMTLGLRGGYALTLTPKEYTLAYGSCYYWGIAVSEIGIIGNIALQNKLVVFDQDHDTIGFAEGHCPKPPSHHHHHHHEILLALDDPKPPPQPRRRLLFFCAFFGIVVLLTWRS